jgi:hypothetical protein
VKWRHPDQVDLDMMQRLSVRVVEETNSVFEHVRGPRIAILRGLLVIARLDARLGPDLHHGPLGLIAVSKRSLDHCASNDKDHQGYQLRPAWFEPSQPARQRGGRDQVGHHSARYSDSGQS